MSGFVTPHEGQMSPHPSSFKYSPLFINRPSIRIAILHPSLEESAVKVTLARRTFADRPTYEALSYTWGSPDVMKGIEINGSRFDVRENLWSALVHLRHSTQERALWIDAIYINQVDVAEGNNQVRLMAHIHERAVGDPLFERLRSAEPEHVFRAWQLAPQRTERHGDSFMLANLIEACRISLCEDPRDKIYGFVGIAHDCEDDNFPIDYSKSLSKSMRTSSGSRTPL
jgi:hypothetical protein